MRKLQRFREVILQPIRRWNERRRLKKLAAIISSVPDFHQNAIAALTNAAKKGLDTTESMLIILDSEEHPNVRVTSALDLIKDFANPDYKQKICDKLLNDLMSPDVKDRVTAAWVFKQAAKKGIDVADYMPEFIKLLESKETRKIGIELMLELNLTKEGAEKIMTLTKYDLQLAIASPELMKRCWNILNQRQAA